MKKYDVYAIGNVLVDHQYEVSDELLTQMDFQKGHMTLMDESRKKHMLQIIGTTVIPRKTGGGSAGNTATAIAQLGGGSFLSCRVGNDTNGHFYLADLSSNQVANNIDITTSNGETGTCFVFITPDAERTMATHLGVTAFMGKDSLNHGAIQASKLYFMEGYLAASPSGLEAALVGREIAAKNQVKLALTLSDASMIQFCKAGLEAMMGNDLDYLFCNEDEAQHWTQLSDINQICAAISKCAKTVCLTRGPLGCIILHDGKKEVIESFKVNAIDTNGAGDMFSGAFIFALTQGYSIKEAATLANYAAAKIVSQYGNRLTFTQMQAIKAAILPIQIKS